MFLQVIVIYVPVSFVNLHRTQGEFYKSFSMDKTCTTGLCFYSSPVYINKNMLAYGFFVSDASEYVIKAQILAGGRGKGTFSNGFKGGVKLTKEYVHIFNSSVLRSVYSVGSVVANNTVAIVLWMIIY